MNLLLLLIVVLIKGLNLEPCGGGGLLRQACLDGARRKTPPNTEQ